MMLEDAENSIKGHESFRSKPYPDPIHGWAVPTFGYGFTYITRDEADRIITGRIAELDTALNQALGFYSTLPPLAQNILIEMAYQMGVEGLLGFHDMLRNLEAHDYVTAAKDGLDSYWAIIQTPTRAKELMDKLETLAHPG